MNHLKSKNGITLFSLAITIIILLILSGIGITIIANSIMDKVITASTKTQEAVLQEKIEMIWIDVEASYWIDVRKAPIVKTEYFKQKLKEKLETVDNIQNVEISGSIDESTEIALLYNNTEYKFKVSSGGKVNLVNSLKGNVQIGDYIEYPVEYTDMFSSKQYTSTNGWRVIDDGVMKGTSGYVKIISAGIPAKWYYDSAEYESNQLAVDKLINEFENMIFLDDSTGKVETKGSDFKVETIANKVTTLSLSDLNLAYNILYKTNRKLNDTSMLEDKYELFHLKSSGMFYYWLTTIKEDSNDGVYYVSDHGIQYETDARIGIRPVIYLKDGLEGKLENNVWKIIN